MSEKLQVIILDRVSGRAKKMHVRLTIDNLSWLAIGGPDEAQIKAEGEARDLWELADLLRCPVKIIDAQERPVWWGYIESATVTIGKVSFTLSIETMHNRVQVTYSVPYSVSSDSGQKTTDWVEDENSVALYGTKEAQVSLSEGTDEQAIAQRNARLAQDKDPTTTFDQQGAERMDGALTCVGWHRALSWQYYEQPAGLEAYDDEDGAVGEGFGTNDSGAAAQSFQIESTVPWTATRIQVNVELVGMPEEGASTDYMIMQLRADAAGVPGATLTSGSVAGVAPTISDSLDWLEITLPAEVRLEPETTYWIVLSRSGDLNSGYFYKTAVNEKLGYSRGLLRFWDGVDWIVRWDADADMLFRVLGVEETSVQAGQMLDAGQFVESVQVETDSGIDTSPNKDGTKTIQSELEELLQSGSGGVRMLTEIDSNLCGRVYAEPTDETYVMGTDGVIRDLIGQRLPLAEIHAGRWLLLRDVLPAHLQNKVFIERLYYTVESGEYRIEPRNRDRLTGL